MPLQMIFDQGSWRPAVLCEVCKEPLTDKAPGCWGCLENSSGTPTPTSIAFVHDAAECRRRYDYHGPVYSFHGRPLSELADLL